jgi:hypothetical protein
MAADGTREVLRIDVVHCEDEVFWTASLLSPMGTRGLSGVRVESATIGSSPGAPNFFEHSMTQVAKIGEDDPRER